MNFKSILLTTMLLAVAGMLSPIRCSGSDTQDSDINNNSEYAQVDNKTTPDQNDSDDIITGNVPKIHFPETTYDFGAISQGDKVSHTFIVHNTGQAPLKLIKAKGS